MNKNSNNINKFTMFLKSSLEDIFLSKELRVFKKMKYVNFLDALSNVYMSCSKQNTRLTNKIRFITTIDHLSNWGDQNKISVHHLARALSIFNNAVIFSDLLKLLNQLKSALISSPFHINDCPDFAKIISFWPEKSKIKINNKEYMLEDFRYGDLLYKYRNCLDHELREQTHSFEDNEMQPYYECVKNLVTGLEEQHLVYPVGFLRNISCNCVNNLHKYLSKNDIDPYSVPKFGQFIIQDLN